MRRWLNNESQVKNKESDAFDNVSDGLKTLYQRKLLPLEKTYRFSDFHSPQMEDADFYNKPMVLLVGQYSTGKTTFIRYLLEQDFPGCRIGPEPTTDGFIAVMHGDVDRVIPGNAAVVDPKKQFRSLASHGNAFLNRFSCVELKNPVLEGITLIDTPGILAGEKQSISRGYDFTAVLEWFAERVDRIILLFDAHKLDISDEFRRSIEALRGHDDKIRIVLNKADSVTTQQLMRVYGALMWSLGKVIRTPEVARVYIGSFWDQPLHNDENRKLFEMEEHDLFTDLQSLPRNAVLRKVNDLIKRTRLAKVHAYIISYLKEEMPAMFGKEKKKAELLANLGEVFAKLQRQYDISPGDFPDIDRMRVALADADFTKFSKLQPRLLETVDSMMSLNISKLMDNIPKEEDAAPDKQRVKGGAFSHSDSDDNPFAAGAQEGFNLGSNSEAWVVEKKSGTYNEVYRSLQTDSDGRVSGSEVKQYLVRTKLPNNVLARIWTLSDIDKDGKLDKEEMFLALYLVDIKLDGHELPVQLPAHLVPPSKRT